MRPTTLQTDPNRHQKTFFKAEPCGFHWLSRGSLNRATLGLQHQTTWAPVTIITTTTQLSHQPETAAIRTTDLQPFLAICAGNMLLMLSWSARHVGAYMGAANVPPRDEEFDQALIVLCHLWWQWSHQSPTVVCHLGVMVGLMLRWPGRFLIWRRGAN